MPASSRTDAESAERPAEPNNASSLAEEAQHGGRIAVVIGSTRPKRICPDIAEWFKNAVQLDSLLRYELIDLVDIDLPFLDEPLKAALHEYEHEHTRNWSRLVTGYDGFVFVFPQYNWGYPAPLKNALDFLYYEWHGKPATSVTYGTRGGNKGAAQLAGVLEGLHMRLLSITELLCDLGLTGQIVGRTGFCIHPWETVRAIPKVGGTKDVKLDRIKELSPTHAILNIDENLRETAEALAEFVPHVIVTHPQTPRDNLDLYRLLGAIFDRDDDAERLCSRFDDAYTRASASTNPPRSVLYLIWREPWMTVAPSTYISRTLALFNWHTQPTASIERYPQVDIAAFADGVDHVLLSSEPYRFRERHLAEIEAAVGGVPVSLIDGEMTSWYGSRAIEGLRYLTDYTATARIAD